MLQGSIIFPMLLNISVEVLGVVIWGSGVGCHQYVDETHLSLSPLPLGAGEVVEVLDIVKN